MSKLNPLDQIEEIYNEHYVYLRNFLIGLTKSDEITDDIIQELFTKILISPASISKVNYMKSWLIRGAKNTLLDYYKKKKPELLADENIMASLLIDYYTPEADVTIKRELETTLSKLSTTDQAIIIAKEYYGYEYQEISELLDIPVTHIEIKSVQNEKKND